MFVRGLHKRSTGSIPVLIALLFILALTLFAWTKRQDIYDWSRLRGYTPPDAIAQLAFDTTMTNEARDVFYVYHPELNDRAAFSHNCSGFGEKTIVLGCYAGNTGIYLFDVSDERLHGVEEVTAAHEMLHAAYDRLSDKERARVDALTAKAFKNVTDDRIKDSIESYRERDASVVPNELHSIIATEVRTIPAELETYYRQYFTNRLSVVAYSEKYESVLTTRRNRAASLELQISGLKTEIELLEKRLSAERDQLRADRAGVKTQEEAVAYNSRVADYNQEINNLNGMITEYNNLVAEYKKVALETEDLYKALDSRPKL
jgi:hypothetical protein